ncbi:MAG: hypothetical protein HFH93_01065 [Lachnospiraceae bacterium]|nr:hypothetical protein [Lachnospiraceae bacterium]
MRKKLLTFILLAGMLVCAPGTVRAETLTSERNVTFTEDSKLSEDRTASDMNSAVYDLQPGDDITITLNLKNDNAAAANWYMTNEVLQSLEETAGSGAQGGAYEYELAYTDPAGTREILFTSDTVGGDNNGSRIGLKAATSGLEDFLYLDTLNPGQRAVITLRVALDGETQGNDYQNTLASLQMNFAVDTTTVNTQTVNRVVDENGDPADGSVSGGNGGDGADSSARTQIVRTGDENDLLPYIIAAGVSGVLFLLLAVFGLRERKKQKKGAKALGIALALCLSVGMSQPAEASSADYTYTLRLFAGAQGTIDSSVVQRLTDAGASVSVENGEVCVIKGLHYGTQVVFDIQKGVSLQPDSKYYRKGFRVSGEDNGTNKLANPSVTVTGDTDFVVSYGIQGETVAYTVAYQDTAGNELYPSAVYYGNVGDKPVVAYQYIEGWQPQAYNLGKTLAADASQNLFTFIYTEVPTVTNVNTVVVPGQPAAPQEPDAEEEPAPPVTVVTPEEPEQEPGIVEVEDEVPPLAEPDEYEDLDEEETPLGGFDDDGDGNGGNGGGRNIADAILEDLATPLAMLPTPAKAGILAAVAALAGAGIWLIIAARRKGKKENEQ